MAYGDWDEAFRELYDGVPGMSYALDDETFNESYAETLFETAFMHTEDELDAMGYSSDEVYAMREEFFDYLGIDAADFDWEEWREAMGYE